MNLDSPMKAKNGQAATLILLVAYSLDLVWKLFHWSELTGDITGWGVALVLMVRFAFMGFLLYLYLRLKKSTQDPQAAGGATISNSFRTILIMHRIMLGAVVLYIVTAERFTKTNHSIPPSFGLSIAVCALVVVMIATGFRRKLLPTALGALRRDPRDAQALVRWRKAHILTMVLLVSVALLGFSLRFVGASFWVAFPFYFVSLALLLVWSPRKMKAANDGFTSTSFGN
jgi:hypothetical protein